MKVLAKENEASAYNPSGSTIARSKCHVFFGALGVLAAELRHTFN
jgi:hypothetical protein